MGHIAWQCCLNVSVLIYGDIGKANGLEFFKEFMSQNPLLFCAGCTAGVWITFCVTGDITDKSLNELVFWKHSFILRSKLQLTFSKIMDLIVILLSYVSKYFKTASFSI